MIKLTRVTVTSSSYGYGRSTVSAISISKNDGFARITVSASSKFQTVMSRNPVTASSNFEVWNYDYHGLRALRQVKDVKLCYHGLQEHTGCWALVLEMKTEPVLCGLQVLRKRARLRYMGTYNLVTTWVTWLRYVRKRVRWRPTQTVWEWPFPHIRLWGPYIVARCSDFHCSWL